MRQGLLAVLVLGLGCGGQAPQPPSSRAAPTHDARVVGGTLDLGDPPTFMLVLTDGTGNGFFGCSATLIGQRTLLTAGHCVSCGITEIFATNQAHPFDSISDRFLPDMVSVEATNWVTPADFSMDCAQGRVNGTDLALIRLAQPPAAPTRPLNTNDLQQMLGAHLRLAGYGLAITSGLGFGRKRTGADALQTLLGDLLHTRGSPAAPCFGDSGSAVMATFNDGVERIIGVTSLTDVDCSIGTIANRVDRFSSFIQTTLATLDDPCGNDDPTCACAADGVCGASCADKSKDPDCPESCASNGVCSRASCAGTDPDCLPAGASCISAAQCLDGQCVTDAQHSDTYCSKTCSGPADCPSGMTCDGSVCRFVQRPAVALGGRCDAATDFCAGAAICVSVGGQPATCRAQCDVAGDCSSRVCLVDAGVPFTGICQEALVVPDAGPPVTPPGTSSSGGCGTVPGGTSGLAALPLLLGLWLSRPGRRGPRARWPARPAPSARPRPPSGTAGRAGSGR
jgi:hypothetical protein